MKNKNLAGKGFESRTTEEQREIAKQGGIASGKARKEKKQLKELLQMLMEQEVGRGKNGEAITGATAMATKAMQEAIRGDWKAWELVRDTAGQKPVDKVMISEVSQEVIEEVEKMVLSDDEE